MTEQQTGIAAYGPTLHCRSCGQPIAFGWTAAGKKCPYDVVDGKVTTTSHFTSCDDPKRFSKKQQCRYAGLNCEGRLRTTPEGRLCGWHAATGAKQ